MFSLASPLIPADVTTSVHAAGLFDWFNQQIDSATVVVQGGTFLVTLVIVLVVAARSRFQLAPTLLATGVGALVIWLVCFDGITVVGQLFGEQIEAQSAVTPAGSSPTHMV